MINHTAHAKRRAEKESPKMWLMMFRSPRILFILWFFLMFMPARRGSSRGAFNMLQAMMMKELSLLLKSGKALHLIKFPPHKHSISFDCGACNWNYWATMMRHFSRQRKEIATQTFQLSSFERSRSERRWWMNEERKNRSRRTKINVDESEKVSAFARIMCCNKTSSCQCFDACLLTENSPSLPTFPLLLFLFSTLGRKQVALCLCCCESSQRVYSLSCQLRRIGVGEQSLGEFKNIALRQVAAFQLLSYMKHHIHQSAFKDFFRFFY